MLGRRPMVVLLILALGLGLLGFTRRPADAHSPCAEASGPTLQACCLPMTTAGDCATLPATPARLPFPARSNAIAPAGLGAGLLQLLPSPTPFANPVVSVASPSGDLLVTCADGSQVDFAAKQRCPDQLLLLNGSSARVSTAGSALIAPVSSGSGLGGGNAIDRLSTGLAAETFRLAKSRPPNRQSPI
ncbi:MAG: hypothetical protein ACR2PL_28650 [Dehalococcoidia bacterium]